MNAHAEFLRATTLDADLSEAVKSDYKSARLTDRERAMLDFAVKLTENAFKIQPEDHEVLRQHGFDDQGILQITLIASWFNYINRVADALGVGRE
ncbi:MAG: peroxidase [Planctomycetota bacterium]|jgi:uncharacterized peroxidase-related enzyme|nr:peroxidase [Planctomycetota bacterium]MDP7250802.1 peroxidase [Planctomycetota bacterium]